MVKLPHWPIPHGKRDKEGSIKRVEKLLNRLGRPHHKLPPVIHVAGTNGKGSTIAMLQAILEEAGFRVHRYTSPHLMRFNERIVLAGKEIDDSFLHETIEEVRIAAGDDLEMTFFEGTTVAAFLAFSKVEADIVLLETGLGGRLDATNVIHTPIMTIVTPISYDHMEYLGESLKEIAAEKAGIIKPSVPCIISWQYEECFEVLKNKCKTLGSHYYAQGEHWNFEVFDDYFRFSDGEDDFDFPFPNLKGCHQIINACTAIAALQCLQDFDITFKNIADGFAKVTWPARMEQITKGVLYEMLPEGWELIVDGAHNNSAAQMLATTMSSKYKNKTVYIINGRTKDRDIVGFLEPFKDIAESLVAVKVHSEPLSESPTNIADTAKEIGFKQVRNYNFIKEAINYCVNDNVAPSVILVCGSLYLAGDVMMANDVDED